MRNKTDYLEADR